MKKSVGKAISFLLILVILFFAVQAVMTPKWRFNPDTFTDGDTDKYGFFYKLPKNTANYFTIGASTSYHSLNPTRIYAKTGITGYCLGHGNMRMDFVYYMLKEGLKTQHPQVVFLDMSPLFHDEPFTTDFTKALVQMRPSLNKLKAALVCKGENQSAIELLFPLFRFHDRWTDLDQGDLIFGPTTDYAQNGTFASFTANMYTDILDRPYGNEYTLEDGTVTIEEKPEKISEKSAAYFEKILALCKENGIELIPTHFAAIWPLGRDKLVEDYLVPFGLELLDMTDPAVGLAWTQDTADSGSHTNFWGCAKGSDYLAEYLRDKGLEDHRGQSGYELWDETLEKYMQWEQDELESRELVNAYDYLNALTAVKDKYLIVLTVKDEASAAWNDTLEDAIHRLGVESSFYDQTQRSFAAILDQGENLFELWDGREIEVNTSFRTADGKEHALYVASGGFAYGNTCSVQIDGVGQSMGARGLNIVAIDKASGKVISSASIDSHVSALTFAEKNASGQWKELERTYQLIEDGVYNILYSSDPAFAAGVTGGAADEDANICLQERNGTPSQTFEFHFIGDGLYTIRAVGSDKYLSIEDMGSTPGSNVVQQTYTGLANQKWFVTENENGSYSFASLHNSCTLDVVDGLAAPGTNIQVWKENHLAPQQFYLEKAGS